MQGSLLLDWRIWAFVLEAAFLVLWAEHCYAKYKEYRAEALL